MAKDINGILSNMEQLQYNPAMIQQLVLDHLDFVTAGQVDVVDPANPFVFCLEAASVLAAGAMAKCEANTRKQYPVAAQTPEDLYLHMSDKDYIDRFAVPTKTTIQVVLAKDELLAKLVLDPTTGYKKLVIPRNTYITVSGVVFSLQYPIEIRQLAHGGLQVVYDGSQPSPLQTLDTNVISWEIRPSNGIDWVFFEFDVFQFSVKSLTPSVSAATGVNVAIPLDDQYYYTRVWVQNTDLTWTEIRTTHTDQVYDVMTPTAVLKVVGGIVQVTIPQIYMTAKMLSSKIRIDVYQTKGGISMDLGSYPSSAFQVTWSALDPRNDMTEFSAPLKNFRNMSVFSEFRTQGGGDALAFEALRSQVINNSVGGQVVPITNAQIETVLGRAGYTLVKNVDNITNRVFLATRELPAPTNSELITAAGASIETIMLSVKDAVLLKSVVDNTSSITITPDTIYQSVRGVMQLVPTEIVDSLLQMPPDKRALMITSNQYYYSPFHYVLDMTSNEFDCRPYYLDAPKAVTKLFVGENDTTLLEISTDSYDIAKGPNGYTLTITTKSSDTVLAMDDNDLHVQLAYIPVGERDRAYVNGTLIGRTQDTNERVYEFDLSTNFNVTAQDNLQLTKFTMYNTDARLTDVPLLQDFDVLFATSAVMDSQWKPDGIDDTLGMWLLPSRIAGITHEQIRIQFGYSLETLWSRARSIITPSEYRTWDYDVPRFYEQDIYQRDATTGSAITIVNGKPTFTVLHKKGDPVLDAAGNPVYQFRKGDIVVDPAGVPVVADGRGLARQIDVMLVEGPYYFANDPTAVAYRTEMVDTFLSWLVNDLEAMSGKLLDKTQIYFYPKATLGDIDVMVGGGLTTKIPAGQSFQVSLTVSGAVYANDALRKQLTLTTIAIISAALNTDTVAQSEIVAALRAAYGSDVIDVQITGLGGQVQVPALTILDPSSRCSIRKRLVAQPDNTLSVEEDVTVNFVKHQLSV